MTPIESPFKNVSTFVPSKSESMIALPVVSVQYTYKKNIMHRMSISKAAPLMEYLRQRNLGTRILTFPFKQSISSAVAVIEAVIYMGTPGLERVALNGTFIRAIP